MDPAKGDNAGVEANQSGIWSAAGCESQRVSTAAAVAAAAVNGGLTVGNGIVPRRCSERESSAGDQCYAAAKRAQTVPQRARGLHPHPSRRNKVRFAGSPKQKKGELTGTTYERK